MNLVIMYGLPCTGKSSLSKKLGTELHHVVFSIDFIKAFFLKTNLVASGWDSARQYGYQLLTDLAEAQLKLNQSVIVEGIFAREEFRDKITGLSKKYSANLRIIECICSNEAIQKSRLLSRKRSIDSLPETDWNHVLKIKTVFTEWKQPHLILDAMDSLEENYLLAKMYIETN